MASCGPFRHAGDGRHAGYRREPVVCHHPEDYLVHVEGRSVGGRSALEDGDGRLEDIAFCQRRLRSAVRPGVLEEVSSAASQRVGATDVGEEFSYDGILGKGVEPVVGSNPAPATT